MTGTYTRRSLLRTGLVAGTVAAAAPLLDMTRWAEAASLAPTEVRPTMCNGCSSHCGMLVHVKNGRVWKAEGHPDHGQNKGKLCARAHAVLTQVYDPDRLTQPLKRVGDRFEPISYEQALDEIAEKLAAILKAHGPGAFFIGQNPRPLGAFYGVRFAHALGSPNTLTHNASCNTSLAAGYSAVFGATPGADLARSKYIVLMGRNPAEGIKTGYTSALAKAIASGAKVVVIDPRQSVSAGLATEWLPIRPGTDLALLLAIAHLLISEKLYDEAFVAEQTTGFDRLAEAVQPYTPAWAAGITGIDTGTITRLALELAAAKPSAVIDPSWKGGFGYNYANSTETARMVGIVNALLGNPGKPGGLTFSSGPALGSLDPELHPNPPKPKVARVDGAGVPGEFPLAPSQGLPHLLAQKAKEGKVKAGLIRHHNPVRNFPDPQHMSEGFSALELLVVVDPYLSETAMLAHCVLPEPSFLEREEIVEAYSGPSVAMRTRVVEKVHPETRGFEEIITGLARRLGVDPYFNFTLDELNAARLAPLGITLDELRQKGAIKLAAAPAAGGPLKFKTGSGKVEFASAKFEKAGFSAVPTWIPPKVAPSGLNPRQFRLIHGKQGYHTHSASLNNPYLLQITRDYDGERLWINAGRAAALGIADGDLVVVRSDRATGTVRAKVTERIHPEAVYLPAGYGSWSPYLSRARGVGLSFNDFVPFQTEPIAGHAMMMEVVVEVEKA
ncbi:MAG: molybdopterin-containing oxidoreductase family protein [Bacillota bacterium]